MPASPRPGLPARARSAAIAGIGAVPAALLPVAAADRARFLRARAQLDAHRLPETGALVRRLLGRADAAHARGDGAGAVDWADKALQLAFHPTVHYGLGLSPLRHRALPLLDPFRESVVGRLLLSDPDPERPERPGGPRLLVLGASSWTFIDRVVERLRERDGVEVRIADLTDLPEADRPHRRGVLEARYAFSTTGARVPVPEALRADLEWADTIWMEWASYPAVWLTLLAGLDARTVVRLHSYEAFTAFPQLMDMAEVDEMVFVSPHVRRLVEASAPRTAQAAHRETVANVQDFSPFTAAKEPGAERTLLQVQWATPVKDVEHSLDILEALRAADPSWRLLLAGTPIPADAPDERGRRIRARLAALGDAVEELGFRRDMPAVYARAGYLLSSSRHEGVHEAVAEGAAAACVPVIRDWPEFLEWGGVAGLYPAEWIVRDVDGAVARILATADDVPAHGAAARRWILRERDLEATLAEHERVLLGGAPQEPGAAGGPGSPEQPGAAPGGPGA